MDLYAGIAVTDVPRALAWYETLFGFPPALVTGDEAVWDLAEHRAVYIQHNPARAGHLLLSVFVDDLEAVVARLAEQGVEPAKRETYADGVRKATYVDPDGNEFGFGGGPLA
ncbi:VOC family protein [Umezawaea sp. NPDC059074]|uniref:VOC family protein n=1 Tax=Umezawaea sp. NPDC059074 TaxID=3346716 RepID=UPI0036947572